MIPLLLLALGLGGALAIYELSPKTRTRFDSYIRAIQSANAAHRAADAHLGNANAAAATAVRHAQQAQPTQPAPTWPVPVQPAPMPVPMQPAPVQPAPTWTAPAQPTPEPAPTWTPPVQPVPTEPLPPQQPSADPQAGAAQAAADAAIDHAVAATEANQAAAQSTADAAQIAETEAQRQVAAQSAAKVIEREKKIEAALASLGVGQCGVKPYPGVTERVKDALLAKLRAEGMSVSGDNPWNIDTQQYGVRLRAVWDFRSSVVKLIVTTGKGTEVIPWVKKVTCQDIWDKIDPIMKSVVR